MAGTEPKNFWGMTGGNAYVVLWDGEAGGIEGAGEVGLDVDALEKILALPARADRVESKQGGLRRLRATQQGRNCTYVLGREKHVQISGRVHPYAV